MNLFAQTVVQSHLADLLIETNLTMNKRSDQAELDEKIQHRLGFIKYLVFKLNGDLTIRIDPDKMYIEFLKEKMTPFVERLEKIS